MTASESQPFDYLFVGGTVIDGANTPGRRADLGVRGDRIAAIGAQNQLTALPSATNFVALDTHRDGAFARRLVDALATEGVFVRMPATAPLDRCIRISCGPDAELDILARALPRALSAL